MSPPTPLPPVTLESNPGVISDQQISLFKFYMDHTVQDGMAYGNELYRLAKVFTKGDRLEAFQFGYKLIEQRVPAIISVSKEQYRVWIGLRNPLTSVSANPYQ